MLYVFSLSTFFALKFGTEGECEVIQVDWSRKRFEAIRETLLPFLTTQTGFDKNKVSFVPVGAMSGENLVERNNEILKSWYEGKTLIETLGTFQSSISIYSQELIG